MKKVNLHPILLHAAGIIAFMILPMFVYPKPSAVSFFNFNNPAIKNLISNGIMIVFFYANYYWLIPRLFLNRRYTIYGFTILVAFAVLILMPSLATGYIPWRDSVPRPDDLPPLPTHDLMVDGKVVLRDDKGPGFLMTVSHNILLFISVALFSVLLRIREKFYEAERAKTRMELLSLKEQINPHFLFNTLNNIYAMAIRDNSMDTANSLLKLSDMMRYVVLETGKTQVSLGRELRYIEDYIHLQKQRLDENIQLDIVISDEVDDHLRIAPLVLIPFIENAFKHGISPDEKSIVKVEIQVNDQQLDLLVFNHKVHLTLAHYERSGKGIENTLARLDYLYPQRYKLDVKDLPDTYQINLQITLDDHSYSDR